MKRLYNKLAVAAFILFSASMYAQEKVGSRAGSDPRKVENEITQFIRQNKSNYRLNPETLKKIREEEPEFTQKDIERLTERLKDAALRQMYFEANNSMLTSRTAVETEVCENSGFEDAISSNFEFKMDKLLATDFTCDMDVSALLITYPNANVNTFTDVVTVVDNNPLSYGGGDPILYSLSTPVIVPRVNSGSKAIKLNDNLAEWSVTTMNKYFIVTSDNITYHFSLVMQNPLDHDAVDQPHFIVRLYNSRNEIVSEQCIVADVNNTQMFIHANAGSNDVPLLYTGWQCNTLQTDNMQIGEEARLEFIITDCGRGAHYATAYIDDICYDEACKPVFGNVNLTVDPSNNNCPEFPIQICGTYTLPESVSSPGTYGALTDLWLNILQNGVIVASSYTPSIVTPSGFCFEFDDTDFTSTPSGDYEFQAIAGFILGSNYLTVEDNSENVGPDLSIGNCCVDYLTITAAVTAAQADEQEADIQIIASNIITSSEAIYHAGDEVILTDGFLIEGSKGHIYIQRCSGSFVSRQSVSGFITIPKDKIELVRAESNESVSIYPNPANSFINVASEIRIISYVVYTLEGKTLLGAPIEKNEVTIDLSNLEKGLYVVALRLEDGSTVTRKIIKE